MAGYEQDYAFIVLRDAFSSFLGEWAGETQVLSYKRWLCADSYPLITKFMGKKKHACFCTIIDIWRPCWPISWINAIIDQSVID